MVTTAPPAAVGRRTDAPRGRVRQADPVAEDGRLRRCRSRAGWDTMDPVRCDPRRGAAVVRVARRPPDLSRPHLRPGITRSVEGWPHERRSTPTVPRPGFTGSVRDPLVADRTHGSTHAFFQGWRFEVVMGSGRPEAGTALFAAPIAPQDLAASGWRYDLRLVAERARPCGGRAVRVRLAGHERSRDDGPARCRPGAGPGLARGQRLGAGSAASDSLPRVVPRGRRLVP